MKFLKFDSKQFKIHFDESKKTVEHDGDTTHVTVEGIVTMPTTGRGESVLMAPFTVSGSGYAKPCGNDSFNTTVGEKVATAKAENSAYKRALSALNETYQKALMFTAAYEAFDVKIQDIKEHNAEYIQRIS